MGSAVAPAPVAIPEPSGGLELAVDLPRECETGATLADRVERFLGEAWVGLGDPSERVSLTVVESSAGFDAQVSVALASGNTSRTFRAQGCDAAMDAAALIVGLAIDPVETATRVGSVAGGASESSTVPQPEPPPPVEPEPEPEPLLDPTANANEFVNPESVARPQGTPGSRALVPGVGIGVAGELGGHFDGPGGGVFASVDLRWKRVHVGVGFSYWIPGAVELASSSENGARFDLWTLEPRVCGVPGRGRFEFPICAGAALGGLRGRTFGPGLDERTARRPWGSFHASARMSVLLGWKVAAFVGAGLHVPLYATPVEYQVTVGGQANVLYETPPVVGHGFLGLEVRFP
jgi:hypothetical protein